MLCDDWRGMIVTAAMRRGADPKLIEHAKTVEVALASAQRFALAPDAQTILAELSSDTDRMAFERARAFCVAPAGNSWIEWRCPRRETRIGFLLESDARGEAALSGAGYIVINARTTGGERSICYLPISWSLPGPEPALTIDPSWLKEPQVAHDFPNVLDQIGEDLVLQLVLAFALIATPRLTSISQSDLDKINKKRRRLGRLELLAHSEISLSLGSTDNVGGSEQAEDRGVGRARHHVRAHYRFRRGKIELVRHHLRGDPRLGHVSQRFVIRAKAGE